MARPLGAVLYQGPSQIDGSPIVAIITGFRSSQNRKTGAMLQTWIMRADIDPAQTVQESKDNAICGECPQRRNLGGTCYVVVEQAPLRIWRTWKAGRYSDWTKRLPDNALENKSVRFGAYGDPAAVPVRVWSRLRRQKLRSWTGYTHQWRSHPEMRPFLMASVDSEKELREAQAEGWRTFRVRDADDPPLQTREVSCPSDRVTCEQCGLCMGSARIAKSVTIVAHGYLRHRRKRNLPVAS